MPFFHKNLFWKLNQAGVLALWIYLIYNSLNTRNPLYFGLLLMLIFSHLLQALVISRRISLTWNFSQSQITVVILLLGYSWWAPLIIENRRGH